MKENGIKMIATTAMTGLSVYLGNMFIPLVILIAVVMADYISGLIKAFIAEELSSRIGMRGILKKLSYFLLVSVGMVADWLLREGLRQTGVEVQFTGVVALMVIMFLIINELLSILENLSAIGVPAVPGLKNLVSRLKISAELEFAAEKLVEAADGSAETAGSVVGGESVKATESSLSTTEKNTEGANHGNS